MAPTIFDIFRVSLKSDTSIPGLADAGVLHGYGDGPGPHPDAWRDLERVSNN